MMNIRYVNSIGQSVNLNARPYKMLVSNLFDSEWYVVKSDDDKIIGFTKGIQKKELVVDCLGDSKKNGRQYQSDLAAIFAVDIVNGCPGRLYCNDEYMVCYITKVEKSNWESGKIVSCSYQLVTDDPMWIRERVFAIRPESASGTGKKYSYTYPYTYGRSGSDSSISINHYDSSDFQMRVYGPLSAVHVTVGGNDYKVSTALLESETLIIDSRLSAPTGEQVYVADQYGAKENAFDLRDPDYSIFAKIPSGLVSINSRGADVDLVVYERRSEPLWR